MTSCADKLNQYLSEFSDKNADQLLWMDENISASELNLVSFHPKFQIVSNRIDDIHTLSDRGIQATFSDFTLGSSNSGSSPQAQSNTEPEIRFDTIFYRISKERFVSHHCINESVKHLADKGVLILIGRKEDGIKSYYDKCRKVLGAAGELKKDKSTYSAVLTFPKQCDTRLDDGNYRQLREITIVHLNKKDYRLYSKPGVFGWKKLDDGTQFLIDTLNHKLGNMDLSATRALDLGCGSGHLSLALNAWGAENITATDNNAAAIAATRKTLEENNIQANIVPTNAGDSLPEKFELIACNPPFHKGFDTDKSISESFIRACAHLLEKSGKAYFVTNAFVNIESPSRKSGLDLVQLANNKQFKVVTLSLSS